MNSTPSAACSPAQRKQLYYSVESEALLGHGDAQLAAQAELAVQGFSDPTAPSWVFGDLAGSQCDLALVRLYGGDVEGAAAAIRPVLDLPSSHRNNGIVVSAQRFRRALTSDQVRTAIAARELREEIEMFPVTRSSQRLDLRELAIDDVDAVFAIYGSTEATGYLLFEPRTRDQVGDIVARSMASATENPRTDYSLAAVERDMGHVIGFGRLALDPHQQRAATFGFALRPDAWGVGYGLETVRLLLGLGFEELALHRIWGARSP